MLLYKELVAYRDAHERVFDREHHFFAAILSNAELMDRFVDRWKSHEQRFEYWHLYLWRILDGYDHRPLPDPPDAVSSQEIGPLGGTNPDDVDQEGAAHGSRGGSSYGSGGGSSDGGGTVHASATPEPSSIVLLLPVTVLALLWGMLRMKEIAFFKNLVTGL